VSGHCWKVFRGKKSKIKVHKFFYTWCVRDAVRNVVNVSENCWRGFQSQRSKVKVIARPNAQLWRRRRGSRVLSFLNVRWKRRRRWWRLSVASLGEDGPPQVIPSRGWHPDGSLNIFCGWIYKNIGETIVERRRGWEWWRQSVGWWQKESWFFCGGRRWLKTATTFEVKRVTPSVLIASGDTNPSDATDD